MTGAGHVVPGAHVGTCTSVAVVKVEREQLILDILGLFTQYIHGLGMEFEIKKLLSNSQAFQSGKY